MYRLDYNPITKRWNERMSDKTKEIIDLINAPIGKENFKKLKASKCPVMDGDIFVCTINDEVYYYGKVIEANLKHASDEWIDGCHVVCIFREKTVTKDLKEYYGNYNNLLVEPSIVTIDYWRKGWFETIGNIPLTQKDKNLDYGFWDADFIGKGGAFKKADGKVLNHKPKYFNSYGVTSLQGIYMDLRMETILDPSLLTK